MASTPPNPTLNLLLADAVDRRPLLAKGLPEDAAGVAPRPEKEPSGVAPYVLEAHDLGANELAMQRWAVIAPEGSNGDAALAAIAPLIALREEEQGAAPTVFRVAPDMDLDASVQWRNDVLRAERVPELERPRYLLILGDLHEVSAELSHVLANAALVGRLHVGDGAGGIDASGYAAYAEKVVRWAREPVADDKADVRFFAADDDTEATAEGRVLLVEPCIEMARKAITKQGFPAASVEAIKDVESADDLLRAGKTARPSVLLSICHGLGRPSGGWESVAQQHALQGALCVGGSTGSASVLTAEALRGRPFLPGGLWFAVACFGAGTPQKSVFHPWLSLLASTGDYRERLGRVVDSLPREGERPFLAALPQAALANPDGPLAVVAHLDLSWTYGFVDPNQMTRSRASQVFSSIQAMVRDSRAGAALDGLMRAYRIINDDIVADYQAQEHARVWKQPYEVDLRRRGGAFMRRNDLRGYVLLGDPAVRLPLAGSRVAPPAPISSFSAGAGRAEGGGGTAVSSSSNDGAEVAKMEEAVLDLIRSGEGPRAVATRHRTTKEEIELWEREYKAAGRERLAKLR